MHHSLFDHSSKDEHFHFFLLWIEHAALIILVSIALASDNFQF